MLNVCFPDALFNIHPLCPTHQLHGPRVVLVGDSGHSVTSAIGQVRSAPCMTQIPLALSVL